MKDFLSIITIVIGSLFSSSCSKEKCQTCTKTIGGVNGNIKAEVKQICDEQEAQTLEASSKGTTVWDCELF